MNRRSSPGRTAEDTAGLADGLREMARPLNGPADLDPLLERVGEARCALLGEASHGTSEYYAWRARISGRLIREKGFSFIAVGGDWPDCYEANRYAKDHPGSRGNAREALRASDRWPTWIWANEEIAGLLERLRRRDDGLPEDEEVGFYGPDVYSLWESMRAIVSYLERSIPTPSGPRAAPTGASSRTARTSGSTPAPWPSSRPLARAR